MDRWLWAVRLTKTRPDAAAACRGGHVRVNDRQAKPSMTVAPGDEVRARVGDTTRIVQVVRVIDKRVGAADAVTCYLDRTPAPPAASVRSGGDPRSRCGTADQAGSPDAGQVARAGRAEACTAQILRGRDPEAQAAFWP